MKTLTVFYSKTGTTKKVAEKIVEQLKCDSEEILDIKSRKGPLGYIRSGREGMKRLLTEIKPTKKDPSEYDLVIIGTPIWGWNMCSPIRTYLTNNKFKKVAFFCTMGGSGDKKAFEDMEELTNKPIATLALTTEQVQKKEFEKITEFVKNMK